MNLYFVEAVNAPAIVVSGSSREQALRIANDYYGDMRPGVAAASAVRVDVPDNARVVAAAAQP